MNVLSIVGDPDAPERTQAEADLDNAARRFQSALEWVRWYRKMARTPHLYHHPDGQRVTREWALSQAHDRIATARSWRNIIRGHSVSVAGWMRKSA